MKIILTSSWVSIHNEKCESKCCSISKFSVYLTHWGRVTQICVFYITTAQDGWRKSAILTRLFSLHNTLNYAIHGACLQMVLLTNVYRNLTSLWIKPRERAFKQFKSSALNVLSAPFICVSAVAAACLKMYLLRGKIQLHYKVIKCLLQSVVTFSVREATKFSWQPLLLVSVTCLSNVPPPPFLASFRNYIVYLSL
jgi:hypothetical protein